MPRRILLASVCFALCAYLTAQEPKTLLTFKGHTDPVYAVAFSPDGKLVATGSFDKSLKLWDAKTGKELRTLAGPQGHQGLVLSVAFSPNGDQLASGGADNFARIWDVPSSKPSKEIAVGGKGTLVLPSPDGKSFAVGNSEGKLKVFALADGKQLADIATTGGAVTGLAFSPNGQTILTTGPDRILRYWNVADGKALGSIGTGPANLNGLVIPASGQATTSAVDGSLRTWPATVPPSKKIGDLPAVPTKVVPSFDGNSYALAFADKSVKVVNGTNGQTTATIPARTANIDAIAWTSDNTTFGVSAGGKATLFGLDGKAKGEVVADAKIAKAVTFSTARTELITAGDDGKMKIWKLPLSTDAKKPTEPKVVPVDGAARFVAALPSGQVIVATATKTVKAYDLTAGKESRNFGTLPAEPTVMSLSRDGAVLAVAAGKTVKLWQTADGKELPFPALPTEANSLSFSSDRTYLLVGSVDKTAWLYQVATGLPVQFYPPTGNLISTLHHPSLPTVVMIDEKAITHHPISFVRGSREAELNRGQLTPLPNANVAYTLGAGKTLTRWNLGTVQKESVFEGSQPVVAYALSRNNQLLAIAGPDAIQIYTLANNQLVGTIKIASNVQELAFHPNNNSLAGRLADHSVRVWNVLHTAGQPLPPEFGNTVQTFPHAGPVASFAYLSAEQLATVADDGVLRVWRVASDTPKTIQHPNLVDCVAFNKDGTQLATACHDGVVRIYDLAKPNNPLFKDIKAHVAMPLPHPVYVVAWSPDSKMLASGSFDKSIKLWDATNGNLVREIKGYPDTPVEKGKPEPTGHRDQVFTLAFSKDGKQLVSGSSDRLVKLWDVSNGNLIREFPNPNLKASGPGQPVPSHAGFVQAVRFSRDGQTIISVGTAPRNQGLLSVWAVADGKLKGSVNIPFGPVYSLDLSADGKTALIGCGPRVRTANEAEAYMIPLP